MRGLRPSTHTKIVSAFPWSYHYIKLKTGFRTCPHGLCRSCRYDTVMVAIALIAGSMTLGVALSRATLIMVFRIAEYTRAFMTRSL